MQRVDGNEQVICDFRIICDFVTYAVARTYAELVDRTARVTPPTRSTRSTTNSGRRAGYVLHCTDIEDGEVAVPTVDRLREIGDVLHDICDGLLEPDEADARPRR